MSRFYLKIFFVHNDDWWWPIMTIYTAQHNFCYDKLVVNFICWGFCAHLSSINKKMQNNSQLLSNLFRNIVNSLVLKLSLEMSSIFYIEVGNSHVFSSSCCFFFKISIFVTFRPGNVHILPNTKCVYLWSQQQISF